MTEYVPDRNPDPVAASVLDRRPHILLVSVLFPPDQGGVEAAAGEFAAAFPRMGYRVTVATTTAGARVSGPADVRVFPRDGFPGRVAAFAREIRPDLVFVNGLFLNGGMGFPFDTDGASGTPVVYRSHGFNTAFRIHWRHPPFFGMATFVRSFARAVLNDCKFRRLSQNVFLDDIKGWGQNFDIALASLLHPKNVSFIPNSFTSVARRETNRFRERFGIPSGDLVFLNVANYCDRKGQVDAVRIIREHPELDARFVFVGSENNAFFSAAERLSAGDSRIRLLAGIPRDDVIAAINSCDVAFLFARQEQQPLFLSEAMSCGKPWFSTNVGSVSKMRGGIVLRRRNGDSFVRAVRELLDSRRREELGTEGLSFWETNYSPDAVYPRWKRLLDDVLSGHIGNRY